MFANYCVDLSPPLTTLCIDFLGKSVKYFSKIKTDGQKIILMLFFLILRCTLEGTQLDSSLMRNFTINILFFIVPVAILWFWPGQLGKHFDILSSSSNCEGNEHRRALRSQGANKGVKWLVWKIDCQDILSHTPLPQIYSSVLAIWTSLLQLWTYFSYSLKVGCMSCFGQNNVGAWSDQLCTQDSSGIMGFPGLPGLSGHCVSQSGIHLGSNERWFCQ